MCETNNKYDDDCFSFRRRLNLVPIHLNLWHLLISRIEFNNNTPVWERTMRNESKHKVLTLSFPDGCSIIRLRHYKVILFIFFLLFIPFIFFILFILFIFFILFIRLWNFQINSCLLPSLLLIPPCQRANSFPPNIKTKSHAWTLVNLELKHFWTGAWQHWWFNCWNFRWSW